MFLLYIPDLTFYYALLISDFGYGQFNKDVSLSKLISTVFLFCAVFSPFTNAETKTPPLKDDLGYVVIPLIIEGQIPKSVKLESTRSFGETYRAKDLKQIQYQSTI